MAIFNSYIKLPEGILGEIKQTQNVVRWEKTTSQQESTYFLMGKITCFG
jgi:hypothetical protein